jgi:hypothetical protein
VTGVAVTARSVRIPSFASATPYANSHARARPTHPAGVLGLPLVLHSSRGSNLLGTARKGKQEVSMCVARDDDADAEWLVVAASGDRLLTDGAPVPVDAPISLLHVMSNVMLAT